MASFESSKSMPLRARSDALHAALIAVALVVSSGILYAAWRVVRWRYRHDSAKMRRKALQWTQRWAVTFRTLIEINLEVQGTPPPPGVLLTPNHLGYLDIVALASVTPCFFVAKSEVLSWPLVGRLLRGSEHLGVVRARKRGLTETNEAIAERLAAGFSVCVFLEGTSGGGERLLPFHASLVEAAVRTGAPIVPVALRWSAERPGVDVAEDIAYWKDHVFAPHLFRLLGLGPLKAEIHFGEPISPVGHDRKTLAALAEHRVAQLLAHESPPG